LTNAATLTIDLGAIARNWRALDGLSGAAETAAAVKADAYGLGLAPVAGALWRAGCRSFFVATLDEGIALRAALPEAAIYILNGVWGAAATGARAHRLIPCLNAPHHVAAWRAAGGGPCALQLDSGMARLGVQPCDLGQLSSDERETLADCVLILSHLACGDTPGHPQNAAQRATFEDSLLALRPILPNARASLAATGGTLLGAPFHLDMVRCGIGLYGGLPFAQAEPVVTLIAPIIQIRTVPEGASVGYGATWAATRPSRIATIPVGYADGFHRTLSGNTDVRIDGRPAPVVGRVSMDLLTIDITDHPEVTETTPVEIIGGDRSIDLLAADAETIGYEMLTALETRYERRYKDADFN